MFSFAFLDAVYASKTFDVLKEIVTDLPLRITQNGLQCIALDSGHVV